jgi:hypothetical protein
MIVVSEQTRQLSKHDPIIARTSLYAIPKKCSDRTNHNKGQNKLLL